MLIFITFGAIIYIYFKFYSLNYFSSLNPTQRKQHKNKEDGYQMAKVLNVALDLGGDSLKIAYAYEYRKKSWVRQIYGS